MIVEKRLTKGYSLMTDGRYWWIARYNKFNEPNRVTRFVRSERVALDLFEKHKEHKYEYRRKKFEREWDRKR